MYYLRFRMVIVFSLDYLRLSFGHFIVSVLLTALVCHCIVSGLPMAFIWSLYCLCTTYDFHLVIVLSLYYVRLSFGHCIVSVLFTAFVWSLYCLCATYGFSLSLYCIWTTYGFRSVIILSLYYVGISFGHCIVSGLLTALVCHCIVSGLLMAFVWSLYCLCTTYGSRLVNWLCLYYLRLLIDHCIVSVLLTAFVWSLYCFCTTYCFRLIIALFLYYLRL
jgi:hypothetical protein